MKTSIYGVLAFMGFALLGPAIASFHVLAWGGFRMSDFLYLLVGQIWPFWAYVSFEAVIGLLNAIALAAGLNVAAYGALGVVAVLVSRSTVGLALLFVGACLAHIMWFHFVMGGWPPRALPYMVLVAACLLLAVPFALVKRVRNSALWR